MMKSQIEGILTRIRDNNKLYNSAECPITDEIIDNFSMNNCQPTVFKDIAKIFDYYAQYDQELTDIKISNNITSELDWQKKIEDAHKKGQSQSQEQTESESHDNPNPEENDPDQEATTNKEIEKVEQKYDKLSKEIDEYFKNLLNNPNLSAEEKQKLEEANENDEKRKAYLENEILKSNINFKVTNKNRQLTIESLNKIDNLDFFEMSNEELTEYIKDNNLTEKVIDAQLNIISQKITEEETSKDKAIDELREDVRNTVIIKINSGEKEENLIELESIVKKFNFNTIDNETLEKLENYFTKELSSLPEKNNEQAPEKTEVIQNAIKELNLNPTELKTIKYYELISEINKRCKRDDPDYEKFNEISNAFGEKNITANDFNKIRDNIFTNQRKQSLENSLKKVRTATEKLNRINNLKKQEEELKKLQSSKKNNNDKHQKIIDKINNKKGYKEVLDAYNALVEEIPLLVDEEIDRLIGDGKNGKIKEEALAKDSSMQINLINKYLAENEKFKIIRNSEILKNDKDILKLKLKNELVNDIKSKLKDRTKQQEKKASRYQWLGKLASAGLGFAAGVGLGALTAAVPGVGVAITAYSIGRATYATSKLVSKIVTKAMGKEPKIITKIKESPLRKISKLFEKPNEKEHPYAYWFLNGVSYGYLADRLFNLHSMFSPKDEFPDVDYDPMRKRRKLKDDPIPDPDPDIPTPANYDSLTYGAKEAGGEMYHLIENITKAGGNIDMNVEPKLIDGKWWYHLVDKSGDNLCWTTAKAAKKYVGEEEFEAAKKIFEGTVGKTR